MSIDSLKSDAASDLSAASSVDIINDLSLFKEEPPVHVIKEYQINTKNLENFLDVPSTDDNYYYGIN